MSATDAVRRLADFGRALVLSRTELARSDQLEAAARSGLQQRRLEELVRHAVERSAFYRDHYRGIDLDGVDLAALPPVTKSQLMTRFDDWVTDGRLQLADLERHLDGLTRDEIHLGQYRVLATSGSTGRRAVLVYSRADWLMSLANFARLNERYLDVHPRRAAHLRPHQPCRLCRYQPRTAPRRAPAPGRARCCPRHLSARVPRGLPVHPWPPGP